MERQLRSRAHQLVSPGKGILAADESTPTIGKRLGKYGIENTEENRRGYRELFLTAPDIGSHLSGCILYKETIYQSTADGRPFVEVLNEAGILVGIKVDEGLEALENCDGESHTRGLDNLSRNCQEYVRQGAAFSKWRAALIIKAGKPSQEAVDINAEELASYASISQAAGLVPIVEPEILIDGTHSIERAQEVAGLVIGRVMEKLISKKVDLEACLLKIQMVMPGSEANKADPDTIAEATISMLLSAVPQSLTGIVFLSGGQSEEEATINLNNIVNHAKASGKAKWGLSFSYGRSLQASVLEIWSKTETKERIQMAQNMAVALAKANALAMLGRYEGPHPSNGSRSLREAFRGWS